MLAILTVLCWNINGTEKMIAKKKFIEAIDPYIGILVEPRSIVEVKLY